MRGASWTCDADVRHTTPKCSFPRVRSARSANAGRLPLGRPQKAITPRPTLSQRRPHASMREKTHRLHGADASSARTQRLQSWLRSPRFQERRSNRALSRLSHYKPYYAKAQKTSRGGRSKKTDPRPAAARPSCAGQKIARGGGPDLRRMAASPLPPRAGSPARARTDNPSATSAYLFGEPVGRHAPAVAGISPLSRKGGRRTGDCPGSTREPGGPFGRESNFPAAGVSFTP